MSCDCEFTFPDSALARRFLTPEFLLFLAGLQAELGADVRKVRSQRASVLAEAHSSSDLPRPESVSLEARSDWLVPALPEVMKRPGIEISGPVSITRMAINALNPGPEGERAVGYLDDDEDSAGHRLEDTLHAAANRYDALAGALEYESSAKSYRVEAGALPFFMHRERGWHLDEREVEIAGEPVSATLLGTALTLFYVGALHSERGESIHFYLPKIEAPNEAALYRRVFDYARVRLSHLENTEIRAIILIESQPAALAMEQMLFELGPYAAGLNAARWDLKASLIEFAMHDPERVWPDRFEVDIKTTPFLSDLFRRLVATCNRHGAVAIGGMATALPSSDPEVNRAAAAAIRKDKEWEAAQGFLRGWVAHTHHMQTAAAPFVGYWRSKGGWGAPGPRVDPEEIPLRIETPAGKITELGTRRNLRTLIEYLVGWQEGRGAVAIDSLAARPGARAPLMEDLATARISAAQVAQRLRHSVRSQDTGRSHAPLLVRELMLEELRSVRASRSADERSELEQCDIASGIAMAWIERMSDLDFTSLGAFSRDQLREEGAVHVP